APAMLPVKIPLARRAPPSPESLPQMVSGRSPSAPSSVPADYSDFARDKLDRGLRSDRCRSRKDQFRMLHVGQAFVIERHRTDKRAARARWKFLTASPAALGNKPALNARSRSTVGIGRSRVATT